MDNTITETKKKKRTVGHLSIAHTEMVFKKLKMAALEDETDLKAIDTLLAYTVGKAKPRAAMVKFEFNKSLPLAEQAMQVMEAISNGELDPETGNTLITTLVNVCRIIEVDTLKAEVAAITEALKADGKM